MKRVSKRPLSKTKVLLLKAAGELFADRGVDAVSLREIIEKAKANVAAVNYHFGSREGLIINLVTMVLVPLWQDREVRMEAVFRKWGNKVIPLEELMDLWVRPIVAVMKPSPLGEITALRVLGRALLIPQEEWPAEVRVSSGPLTDRWQDAVKRSLGGLGDEGLGWRVDWMHGGLAKMLLGGGVAWKKGQLEAACSAFVKFAIHGLRGGEDSLVEVTPKPRGPQATFDF